MTTKKSNPEWLRRQVEFLSAWGERPPSSTTPPWHEYREHTGLKLAALNHAVGVFTPIAAAQVAKGTYARSVFVDLFAGCGVNRIRGTGDILAGSPLIAANARKRFDELVLVEKDPVNEAALRTRLQDIGCQNFSLVRGDCNQSVSSITSRLGKRDLVFVCVDPEGLEAKWSTITAIRNTSPASDFFINLTFGAERAAAAARGGSPNQHELAGMMGMSLSDILLNPDHTMSSRYEANVRSVLGKESGGSTLVTTDGGQPLYRLLIYGRRTKGDSPWEGAYSDIERRLSTLRPADVIGALNDIKKRGLSAY